MEANNARIGEGIGVLNGRWLQKKSLVHDCVGPLFCADSFKRAKKIVAMGLALGQACRACETCGVANPCRARGCNLRDHFVIEFAAELPFKAKGAGQHAKPNKG